MTTAVQTPFTLWHEGQTGRFDNGLPMKTTQGHGPMLETGETVSRGRYAAKTVVCPNERCGHVGFYTNVGPVTAFERLVGLQGRNAALRTKIDHLITEKGADGTMDRKTAALTLNDRSEWERNRQELERLRAMAPDAQVGWKFVGSRSGGLVIVPAPQTVDALVTGTPPAPVAAAPVPTPEPAKAEPVVEKPSESPPYQQPKMKKRRTKKQMASDQAQRDRWAAKHAEKEEATA